jgi:Arc/MetJ-type ribon-helix-helix transcriptional regulator
MRFDIKKYISSNQLLSNMNPILNVRVPDELQKMVSAYYIKDGYANMQELVKALLREYALDKKRQELMLLWGSQKPSKLNKRQVREMVAKKFFENASK